MDPSPSVPTVPVVSPPSSPPFARVAPGGGDPAASALLEESRPVALARLTILVIAASLLAGGIWAGLASVPVRVAATGRVLPPSPPAVIAAPDGGVIARIEAHDGDSVSAGQVLVRLDPAPVAAGLDQARAQLAAAQARADRLRGRIDTRPVDLTAPPPPPEAADAAAGMDERRAAVAEAEVTAEIERAHAILRRIERDGGTVRSELEAARQRLRERQEQAAHLLISRARLQAAEQDVAQIEALRGQLQAQDQATRAALAEAEARLTELRSGQRRQAMEDLTVTLDEVARAREAVARLEQRSQRLELRAPAAGVVRGLAARRPGESLPPGEAVASLLPTATGREIEIILPLPEGTRVHPGQAAWVRPGGGAPALAGKVDWVAEAAADAASGHPALAGRVVLPPDPPDRAGLLPGQSVGVAVVVGERPLLRALFAPVLSRLGVPPESGA